MNFSRTNYTKGRERDDVCIPFYYYWQAQVEPWAIISQPEIVLKILFAV